MAADCGFIPFNQLISSSYSVSPSLYRNNALGTLPSNMLKTALLIHTWRLDASDFSLQNVVTTARCSCTVFFQPFEFACSCNSSLITAKTIISSQSGLTVSLKTNITLLTGEPFKVDLLKSVTQEGKGISQSHNPGLSITVISLPGILLDSNLWVHEEGSKLVRNCS